MDRPPQRPRLQSRAVAIALAIAVAGLAASATPSVAGHHLFHATPDSLIRELSADRPDVTESPYTLDAGHAQVEMDLVRYVRDRDRGDLAESWSAPALNVKLGLDRATDLQILLECYRHDRFAAAGPAAARFDDRGFGDFGFRLKRNLRGNDAGRAAFAVMPFVLFPRDGDGRGFEAGVVLPFAYELGGGWGLGLMGEVDFVEDADGDGRHAEWLATATTGHAIAGPLAAFVEFAVSTRPAAEGRTVGTADAGLTFAVSPDLQLDAGVYLGTTDAADDRTFFLGLTARR
ncbi:MAG TPA: transporter [Acidobacteriota bacterium]|nr:transporter [Acidobacteriota bacterium]